MTGSESDSDILYGPVQIRSPIHGVRVATAFMSLLSCCFDHLWVGGIKLVIGQSGAAASQSLVCPCGVPIVRRSPAPSSWTRACGCSTPLLKFDNELIEVISLLSKGVDPNHTIPCHEDHAAVQALVRHGIGHTPAIAAAWGGHPAAMQTLLTRGADPNRGQNHGDTPAI